MSENPENMSDRDTVDPRVSLNTNLVLMFSVTITAVLGVSSITPAFPKIMRELHLTTFEVGMLISVFTVPGVMFALVMGILADRLGRKKILVPALMVFGIAGGMCGFVRDFHILLVLRFFQGIGGAALGTLGPTILGDLYSGKARTVVMGYNASVLNVGTAGFPALGGALALFGWHYPFLLPFTAIPLGICILYFLKNPEPRGDQTFREYINDTLLSLRRRQVIGILTIGIFSFLILYGSYLTFYPILLDSSFGASSFRIGIIMSLTSVTAAITSSQIKFFVKRIDEKILLRFGFFLYALSMALVPFIVSFGEVVIPVIVYGIGMGINIPCLTSLLTSLAPLEHRAAFLSINSMMLRVGQTLGPVIMGYFFGIWGIPGVFYAGAGCALLMVATAAIMVR